MKFMPSYSPSILRRVYASGAIGNVVETYDMILVTLMASFISLAFLPPTANVTTGIVHVLYIFLIGFMVRPLGTLVMGLVSDSIGRKRTMIISIIMTGLSTFLMGLLPTYQMIGIYSTILFVILRVLQSFFTGVEYINSTSYLIENGRETARGYFASWAAIGISGGYLAGSLIVFFIERLIGRGWLPEIAWRLVFLFSIFGIYYGYWIRLAIPESFEYIMSSGADKKSKRDIIRQAISFARENRRKLIAIYGLSVLGCMLSYLYYIYIPINLTMGGIFSRSQTLFLNIISLSLVVALIPFFGWLSDKVSKKNLLQWVCILVFILAYPFAAFCHSGSFTGVLSLLIVISVCSSCFFSVYPRVVTEMFPVNIRCTVASFVYQVSVTSIMSILPLLVLELTNVMGSVFALSSLMIFSAGITLATIYTLFTPLWCEPMGDSVALNRQAFSSQS